MLTILLMLHSLIGRKAVYNRLENLVDKPGLRRKKLGNVVIYYLPADGRDGGRKEGQQPLEEFQSHIDTAESLASQLDEDRREAAAGMAYSLLSIFEDEDVPAFEESEWYSKNTFKDYPDHRDFMDSLAEQHRLFAGMDEEELEITKKTFQMWYTQMLPAESTPGPAVNLFEGGYMDEAEADD